MATTSFQLGIKTEKYLLILPELIQSSFKGVEHLGGNDFWQTVPGLFVKLRWRNFVLTLVLYSFMVLLLVILSFRVRMGHDSASYFSFSSLSLFYHVSPMSSVAQCWHV